MKHISIARRAAQFAVFCLFLLTSSLALAQAAQGAAENDPLLSAMRKEMERSKAQLKLENVAAPYYIDYRIVDVEEYSAEAAFGSLRQNLHSRVRVARVVVRVGDYKQDSFYERGEGDVGLAPLDNDELSIRHQLWLATDRAYKAASQALTAKQAALKQFTVEQPVDDFAKAEPVHSIGPLAKLPDDITQWVKMLQAASALYKNDPDIEDCSASLHFQLATRYFVNSEGTETRSSQTLYRMNASANTQAADGMRLERSNGPTVGDWKTLPTQQEFLDRTTRLVASLKSLRDAPVADEEYHGPVLFAADPATGVFATLVGDNILGLKPSLGQPARTRGGFANNYKSRVLPEFLSVEDDPTIGVFEGKPLLGHYDVDDEGVKAQKVVVIKDGKLENFLVSRTPIRDFPSSNGHGRARIPANSPGPSLGNLIVRSSQPVSTDEMKKKLIDMLKDRGLAYGYLVEALGPGRTPRMLYRVYAKDGREELVRGASFGDLDTRSMRTGIVAAGSDYNVENSELAIPHSVVAPSILFDELEVKRANANKDKLPEYPAPAFTPVKAAGK